MSRIRLLAALACGLVAAAQAEVRVAGIFTGNMVLQRGMKVPIWGTAAEGEKVSVRFREQTVSGVSKNGRWMLTLEPMQPGPASELIVEGATNLLSFKNVVVGEVWICSGQSNMQWSMAASFAPETEIPAANHPDLRLFTVPRIAFDQPMNDVKGEWTPCTPATARDFSAVAYYFGRDLHKKLGVPVGLISTNYGGTPAEAWTTRAGLSSEPGLQYYIDALDRLRNPDAPPPAANPARKKAAEAAGKDGKAANTKTAPKAARRPFMPGAMQVPPNTPTGLYNAMIHPIVPYAIRGAIWYQGESNAGKAMEYRKLFPAMIKSWRQVWRQGDFPFLFVQLAPFMDIVKEPGESNWAELREAQLLTLSALKQTGMAVITDVGEEKDIHPKKKQPVGERLASAARALAYGEKIVYSGPVYRSMTVEGNKAVLEFDHVGGGLECKGDKLTGFAIKGADGKFVNADAVIEGNKVVVTSPSVATPTAVRFGWANFPVVNLWNKDGFPATPFRTDVPPTK